MPKRINSHLWVRTGENCSAKKGFRFGGKIASPGQALGCSGGPLCPERVYMLLQRALKVKCRHGECLWGSSPSWGQDLDPPENSGINWKWRVWVLAHKCKTCWLYGTLAGQFWGLGVGRSFYVSSELFACVTEKGNPKWGWGAASRKPHY